MANHRQLAQIIDGLTRGATDGEGRPPEEVHLDLGEVEFIDVGGVRILVTAAAELGAARQLVIHRPPTSLIRILELLWPKTSGLRVQSAPARSAEPSRG